ncbi:type II secretion system protein [Aliivibrio wodanis]|uniref:type II secretion system protein n=1 Tax=Aliivibrio wodanis TaxID=80852 RepID=UPI00406CF16C
MKKQFKTKGKQRGLASVVALAIVAAALTLGIREWSAMLTQKQIQDNSQSFYNRIVYLQTQFHAYMSDKYLSGSSINTQFIFPMKLSDLEGDYIPLCSDEDNKKGFCFKYNQTPWGEITAHDYRLVPLPNGIDPTHWRAELDMELPPKNDEALKYEREMTLQMFAKMPNIIIDDEKDKITLRIDRPDKAFAYESLVKRSGDDSTLLGDWDVGGNHAITNAKDYTIKNSDGTQQSVAIGLTHIYTVEHGQWLQKPSCPQGTTLESTFTISEINPQRNYLLTGLQRAYLQAETPTHVQVGLDVGAKHKVTNRAVTLHLGKVTALLQCK